MTQRRRGPVVSPSRSRPLARAVAVGVATTGLAALGLLGLTGCVQDPMPFDPRLAQQWEREQAYQTRGGTLESLPTAAEARYVPHSTTTRSDVAQVTGNNGPSGRPVRMRLQEVIYRAVANNLDIRVAGFDTAIDQTRVLEAIANFDPSFFSDISFERVDKQVGGGNAFTVVPGTDPFTNSATNSSGGSIFQSFISRVDQEALTNFDAGFRQNLPAGGKIELKQQVANTWFFPTRSLENPNFENDLVLSITQPLLQNFGVAVNQARITIARNTQRVSLLDFRKTVEETVLKIEQTYWQLVQTERDVETQRRLVKQSEDTSQLLYDQRGKGLDVSAAEVNQANAQTDSRRVDLIALEARLGDLSDQLKVLMNDPAYPVSGAVYLSPADDFLSDPLHFNVDDLIETGLENRLELGQDQVRIESAEIAVDVARNGLLPSLTAQIQATVDGLSKTLGQAFQNQGDWNHVGYQFGLQFQMPIGNRAARAVWQRALLQRLQAIAGYGSQVEKVTADVKTGARAVETSWKRLYAAHNAVLEFRKLLDNLRTQVESGNQPLTFEFVFNLLQDQELLAGAERAEHLAENDYNFAIAQLEDAKGTILRYNHVMMEQEPLPFDLDLAGSLAPRPTPPGYPYPDRVVGPLGR